MRNVKHIMKTDWDRGTFLKVVTENRPLSSEMKTVWILFRKLMPATSGKIHRCSILPGNGLLRWRLYSSSPGNLLMFLQTEEEIGGVSGRKSNISRCAPCSEFKVVNILEILTIVSDQSIAKAAAVGSNHLITILTVDTL